MIAQLSQTMSFVLDATVEELLILHAESRGMNRSVVKETLVAANELSGESFTGATALTNLSGGQTRALMVADTALVCRFPNVLIDEIENADIDRRKAFDLLLSQKKNCNPCDSRPASGTPCPKTSLHVQRSDALTAMLKDPILIRRPLIEVNGIKLTGFNIEELVWCQLQNQPSAGPSQGPGS